MSELILVKPLKVSEEKILEYKQEWLDFGESSVNGSCVIAHYNNFNEWLKIVIMGYDIRPTEQKKNHLLCSSLKYK